MPIVLKGFEEIVRKGVNLWLEDRILNKGINVRPRDKNENNGR